METRALNRAELSFTEFRNIKEDQHICIGGTWGRAISVSHDPDRETSCFAIVPDKPAPGNLHCKPVPVMDSWDTPIMIKPEDHPQYEKRAPRGAGAALACFAGAVLWALIIYLLREGFGQSDFSTSFLK